MIKVVITLVRKEELTLEEFTTYWREEHAPLADQLPHLRKYTISEPVDEDTAVDGIAQLYYETMDDFKESMESDIAERVREDTPTFADPEAGNQYVVRESVRFDEN